MVDCCELALYNGRLALYIALGAFSVISLLLAMFFGYNLKLDGRTAKLEKKNGKEETLILTQQAQINELQAKLEKLEKSHA